MARHHRRPLFQGPDPPWCIGSIFPAPQLIAGSEARRLGPLLFDRIGEPQQLLSTGFKLHLFEEPIYDPFKQADAPKEDLSIARYSSDLVSKFLNEDVSIKLAKISDSNQSFGNRLQCLKYRDDKLQLLFPVGENLNSIGSILCEQDANGNWYQLRNDAEGNENQMSISRAMCHPIRQLSAMNKHPSNSDDAFLVARTEYEVHAFNLHRKKEHILFGSSCRSGYRKEVSHVALNPHQVGEIAVTFGSGEVHIYDVESERNILTHFHSKYVANEASQRAARIFCAQNKDPEHGFPDNVQSERQKLRKSWWRCEYSWHPKTLIIAGSDDVFLHDSRAKCGNTQMQLTELASIHALGNYLCHQNDNEGDRFVALSRSDEDHMYHFATATQRHVFLFDVRRPKNPLLQWEHSMTQDYPGLLLMHPLSSLRPVVNDEFGSASLTGRMILAASCRSGDIRAFCYGPRSCATSIVSGANSRFRDVEESYCAWEYPSKLFTAKTDNNRWMEELKSVAQLLRKHRPKLKHNITSQLGFLESMSGLLLLPPQPRSTQFTLIQLCGTGDLLTQRYKAAKALKNSAPKGNIETPPTGLIGKPHSHSKYEEYPALLNYVRHGCVFPKKRRHADEDAKVMSAEDEEAMHAALADATIPLCVHEVAFKMLQKRLCVELASAVTKMPANISGYLYDDTQMPYLLPPCRILEVKEEEEEEKKAMPLPLAVEMNSKEGGHKCIVDACNMVEGALTKLKHKIEEESVVSLNDSDDPWNTHAANYFFHTVKADVDSRFCHFVASSSSSSSSFSVDEHVQIQFRSCGADDVDASEVMALNELKKSFENWGNSFVPYRKFNTQER